MKKIMSLVIAGMILLVGCGKPSDNSSQNAQPDNSVKQQSEPTNKLEKIKASGKLVVGTSADYPPYEFHMMIDGGAAVITANDEKELMAEINKILAELKESGKIEQFVADCDLGIHRRNRCSQFELGCLCCGNCTLGDSIGGQRTDGSGAKLGHEQKDDDARNHHSASDQKYFAGTRQRIYYRYQRDFDRFGHRCHRYYV